MFILFNSESLDINLRRFDVAVSESFLRFREAAFQAGEKPVTATVVQSVLSKQLDDLEPTLTRHGYNVKTLAEQFGAKPTEIRALFRGQLEPSRMRELQDQMLAAGLPL
jgi:AraC-like DNA-binding protein